MLILPIPFAGRACRVSWNPAQSITTSNPSPAPAAARSAAAASAGCCSTEVSSVALAPS